MRFSSATLASMIGGAAFVAHAAPQVVAEGINFDHNNKLYSKPHTSSKFVASVDQDTLALKEAIGLRPRSRVLTVAEIDEREARDPAKAASPRVDKVIAGLRQNSRRTAAVTNLNANGIIEVTEARLLQSLTTGCLPTASKIRLTSSTGVPIQVSEVKVLLSDGTNVAEGKTAIQGSTYKDKAKYDASKAVDGDESTFSHTQRDCAWFEVDLGGSYEIASVLIINRYCGDDASDPKGCLCKLSHATVSLLDDEGKWVEGKWLGDTCGELEVESAFTAACSVPPSSSPVSGAPVTLAPVSLAPITATPVTASPSNSPSVGPSVSPSGSPSNQPTPVPSASPSNLPSVGPSVSPSSSPSKLLPNCALSICDWEQAGLDIDGEAANDRSGNALSLSSDGSTVAIGAFGNDGAGTDAGHVRVYKWDGSGWAQLGNDIDGEAASDSSGIAVSLSSDGTTVAIGAYYNDGNGANSGHVRVYKWDGTNWSQVGGDIDGENHTDWSGGSVSISSDGNTVAIGASGNYGDASLGSKLGHVRVYKWDEIDWSQVGGDIDGEAGGDQHSFADPNSVSLSSDGNTVAFGARFNGGAGYRAGHVRVLRWDGSAWAQAGLDIDGEAANDQSGRSLSLSSDGNTVAIGASGNDGNGSDAGHVRVFKWNGSAWAQHGNDINGEAANDYSGWAVSLSSDGNTVAIGAKENGGAGYKAGQVRVYTWNGISDWSKVGDDIDGEAANDQSGWAVSLSSGGNTVAIGAHYNDGAGDMAGHVRVYTTVVAP